MKRFADNGSALDREDWASRDGGAVQIVAASIVASRNEHNARQHGAKVLSTPFASVPKLHSLASRRRLVFRPESFEGDGLKNRRLAPCKIWIREVLISVRLNLRGEVAERLKAAVC